MTLPHAQSLLEAGNRSGALEVAARLAKSMAAPQDLVQLARFLALARAHPSALEALARAWDRLKGNGDVSLKVVIHVESALIYRALGESQKAQGAYRSALALDPTAAAALKGLSEMGADIQEALMYALPNVVPNSQAAALLYFSLSKTCHDLGDTKTSWKYLSLANQIERAHVNYDPALDRDLMFAIRYAFSDIELFDESASGPEPIFILGLPRTGTTLLERILSNHPEVEGGGELTAMPQAAALYGAPEPRETAARLLSASGPALAGAYARIARSLGVCTPHGVGVTPKRWTDKQCLNFLYCPLLLRAFPRASLISIERHPLATIYAMYRARFPGDNYPFAYDLTELADFYIGRARLLDHWRAVLPNRLITVTYEDLIEHFDQTVRWLLTVLKLSFDIACLGFDRNPAPVLTMSAEQVREPLYRSSLNAWQAYARELAPARRRLEAAGIDCA